MYETALQEKKKVIFCTDKKKLSPPYLAQNGSFGELLILARRDTIFQLLQSILDVAAACLLTSQVELATLLQNFIIGLIFNLDLERKIFFYHI